jgi:DNA polymerase-3 subunit alpha
MKKFDSKMIVCGYENLHVHSDFSTLDGYGQVEEYADRCTKINMNYLCVTDHGMMGVIPRQIRACDKMGLKAIFGIELYVNDSRVHRDDIKLLPPDEKADASTSYHLLAIAYNNIGYSNLVQLSSWAWLHGFYKKPRVNHEQLIKHREGIIFTSCCYNSEVGRAFDRGGADAADAMIEKYIAMFGDNYYLEFMLLDFHKQRAYNAYIVRAAEKYGRKILLTNDTHYCNKCDSRQQQYMLMIRNNTTIKSVQLKVDAGEDVFEMQDSNLWLKSEDELDQKYIEIPPESRWREGDPYSKMAYSEIIPYEVYCQAKRNTVDVCRKAAGVELDRSVKLPQIP